MANSDAPPSETYRSGSVTADIVQQGTGNAARDINKARRDINNAGGDIHNNNITILPSCQPKSVPSSTVPFRRDDDFVTRDSLDEIQQICARPAGRAALVGLGGVGKSQIAIEYAYQVRDASLATWVFWVHAGTKARFEEGYRRIAEATKMDGWDKPKADVLRLVRNWLCDESNGRWTMVVDNADDASVFFPRAQGIQAAKAARPNQAAELLSDFLPQSANGSIVVTSRNRDVAFRLTGSYASVIKVEPMGKDDALALLQKKLGLRAGNTEKATELLQALDGMPLAITQAAAYIMQRGARMSVSRYLDEMRRSDHERARLLEQDVGDIRRDGRASNSIMATWQISFEHMRREMPTAARLLSLMSLFDRQGIPESLLRDQYGVDKYGPLKRETDFDDDVHTLTSYSLVEMSADGSEFEMHRLVQYSTKKWLELSDELEAWKERYVVLMDNSYPEARYGNWKVCRALFPHAQAAVGCHPGEAKAKALEAWASVLYKAAWYATEMGQYKVAHDMDAGALEVREALLGKEHPDTLNTMINLAMVLLYQIKYEAAEAMNRRALEGFEKVLEKEDCIRRNSMHDPALVLLYEGDYKTAELINWHVLEEKEKALGKECFSTLASVSILASTLQLQGKYEAAEAMNRRALEGFEKVLGKEHPLTLNSVYNLALIGCRQHQHVDALSLHERAISGYEHVLGPEHPTTVMCSKDYSALIRKMQRKQ
ncbi:hypothetical protein K504DRAFT_468281 [Pleomassaria siparia CBS 279.74]|uniref:DUF7779 domain-containing protein n=1 Tax=Pleomassaria siparia CBS 279.74 TaxID=1314801 RepID=A0A6G1K8G9_9PLEO|nr:hypothetical protein K504DRAFT_468281 [Pleomassaria siparia CBS 279.74]